MINPTDGEKTYGNTDCVNFHVGEFGSPSPIFYSLCGGEKFLAQQLYYERARIRYRDSASSIASRSESYLMYNVAAADVASI